MLAIYLLVGFFIGKHTAKMLNTKNINNEKTAQKTKDKNHNTFYNQNQIENNNNNKKNHKIRVRKRMKKYFSLKSNSQEKISPGKISVKVKKRTPEKNKSSPEPNFIALTVLWAHYAANQLGLLKEEGLSPWYTVFNNEEKISEKKTKPNIGRDSWKNFLSSIIKDKNWTRWIKNPDEVKKRTLLAFQN